MLTGPVGGEGITTVACLFGRELSEMRGGSVVIVDANLRAPGVHRRFSIDLDNGLRDWEPESAERTVHPSAERRQLSVMTAGSNNGRSLYTLQHSGRLDQLVAQLRRDFSFVLWDTPPLNLYSDGKVLLPHVDGVLVVVEGDSTRLDALAKLYEELAGGSAPVLGAIINRSGRYYGPRPAGGRALRRLPS
jgi:Mrp family chromosome partitioning ATPase